MQWRRLARCGYKIAARRAEQRGMLPTGTAARWADGRERAMSDRTACDELVGEVDASACRSCGDALALFGVSAWPLPDAALLAEVRRALDHGLTVRGRIYLSAVRDRGAPELAQLTRRLDGFSLPP